jgi:hypothetical protein
VGKLLKCTIAWAQLGTGMSYSILAQVTISLPHLEAKWIASLREFLATISASIRLDDPCIPPHQRENDKYLMDLIIQSGRYTPAQVRKLNYCRLYLQAVTLSDITKPNGHKLDPCLLSGRPSLFSNRTRWHTVQQVRPSESEWKLWKTANSLWSDPYGQLFQPLGAWLQSLPNHRFQLFAYKYGKSLLSSLKMESTRSSDSLKQTGIAHRRRHQHEPTSISPNALVPQKSAPPLIMAGNSTEILHQCFESEHFHHQVPPRLTSSFLC